MSDLTIITNNQARDLVALIDIPAKARKDFDYIKGEDAYSPRLFCYKGDWYDSDEFERVDPDGIAYRPFYAWHGIQTDSFFSGIVIRYAENYERVVVGCYYS